MSASLEGSDPSEAEGTPKPPTGDAATWLYTEKAGNEVSEVFDALFDVPAEPQRLGEYAVLGTMGRGSTATVFEAFDPALDRRVALKVLHRGLPEGQQRRLLEEAEALAELSHPGIVQVHGVGTVEDQSFIVTEIVRGRTLTKWLEQQPRPTWREALDVYLQAGDALAAAHAAGFVHRDFKPATAVIDDEGQVRLLDLELAEQPDDPAQEPDPPGLDPDVSPEMRLALYQTGTVRGTPAYMPLEQMRGRRGDARSDQFGFCVSLYEALYAERPFDDSSMDKLVDSMLSERVRAAPASTEVPTGIRSALLRGLSADPERRWPSMDSLLAELRRQAAPSRRWRGLAVLGGLAVLALVVAAGVSVIDDEDEGPSKSAAALDDEPTALGLRAITLREQGQLDEALELHQRALALREATTGPRSIEVARSLTNIAAVLHDQGQLDQALVHGRRALEIYEYAYGPHHPAVATHLVILAQLALAGGELDTARGYADRAFRIRSASEPPVGPEQLAEAEFVLAQALLSQPAEQPRALQLARRAGETYAGLGSAYDQEATAVRAWLREAQALLGTPEQ